MDTDKNKMDTDKNKIFHTINKKCFNLCPNCGAGENDIDWGGKDWGEDMAWQKATCNKCGCEFEEFYRYCGTESIIEQSKRIKCDYPMSEFYIYKDEVGPNEVVSTIKSCEACEDENCDVKHCLMVILRKRKSNDKSSDKRKINSCTG